MWLWEAVRVVERKNREHVMLLPVLPDFNHRCIQQSIFQINAQFWSKTVPDFKNPFCAGGNGQLGYTPSHSTGNSTNKIHLWIKVYVGYNKLLIHQLMFCQVVHSCLLRHVNILTVKPSLQHIQAAAYATEMCHCTAAESGVEHFWSKTVFPLP